MAAISQQEYRHDPIEDKSDKKLYVTPSQAKA